MSLGKVDAMADHTANAARSELIHIATPAFPGTWPFFRCSRQLDGSSRPASPLPTVLGRAGNWRPL